MEESKSKGLRGALAVRRSTSTTLRHETDFEVLSVLGRGGFGVVWKVKNLVDQGIYALKKIRLNKLYGSEGQANDSVMREVAALRQLHDPHIVRYFGAWIEAGDEDEEQDEEDFTHSSSSLSNPGLADISRSKTFRFDKDYLASAGSAKSASVATSGPNTSGAWEPDLQCNICREWYGDWEVSFEDWSMLTSSLQPMNLCQKCYRGALASIGVDLSRIHIRQKAKRPLYLFIQMEFCDANLYQELEYCGCIWEEDSESDPKSRAGRLWTLFREIVAGVCSMHNSSIAHRDLKPSNIFIQNGHVKIGDLGLAKDMVPVMYDALPPAIPLNETLPQTFKSSGGYSNISSGLTSCVGTYLYIAPEVLAKPQCPMYDQKCDIFALGIILLEMFQPFLTSMERVETLSAVRKRVLPAGLEARHPGACRLIALLTHPDPRKRPSAHEIMESLDTYSGFALPTVQIQPKNEQAPAQAEPEYLDDPLSARLDLQTEVRDLRLKLEQSERLVASLQAELAQKHVPLPRSACLFCGY